MARLQGQKRQLHDPDGPRFLYDRVVIHGLINIAGYMGCTPSTVQRWIRKYSFPAAKLPNGGYATTTELIDRWLLSRNPHIAPHLTT